MMSETTKQTSPAESFFNNFEDTDFAALRDTALSIKANDPNASIISWELLYSNFSGTVGGVEVIEALRNLKPADLGREAHFDATEKVVDPSELVRIEQPYVGANGNSYNPLPKFIPKDVFEAHKNMNQAYLDLLASQGGNHRPGLIVVSGYRSPAYQALILIEAFSDIGPRDALQNMSLANHSEHSDDVCTALDYTVIGDSSGVVNRSDPRGLQVFEDTQEFNWLIQHAPSYGFALTYYPDPENPSMGVTEDGFTYEPWHWRFMGADAADFMATNNVVQIIQDRKRALTSIAA